jgi:uncharacterized protein YqjF (DUF2071 family)
VPTPFLTARWEELVFLSWRCPAEVLTPLVPGGTVLDPWQGEMYLSLVGLMFRDTRILGVPIPGHRTFEEVNLRFYVRREMPDGEIRRAVVFIRELVPRRAIALIARLVYNEPYVAVPVQREATPAGGTSWGYRWMFRGQAFGFGGSLREAPQEAESGSLEGFITEHYWGYTQQRDGGTLEYRVDHSRWPIIPLRDPHATGPFDMLYGPAIGEILTGPPASALAAAGSPVSVHRGVRLTSGG